LNPPNPFLGTPLVTKYCMLTPESQNVRRSDLFQSALRNQEYSYTGFVVVQIAHNRLGEACAPSERGFRRYWHEAQLIVRGSTGDWHPWLHSVCTFINSKSFVLIILFRNLNDFKGRSECEFWLLNSIQKHDMRWQVKLDACTVQSHTSHSFLPSLPLLQARVWKCCERNIM
jgi:hypothetical protein